MIGVPLKPGDHGMWNRRHRLACRECRDEYNAYLRRYRLATGRTLASRSTPTRTREDLTALGELYGDALRNAVLWHLCAHPAGLAARDIARALRMLQPDGSGQVRVRYQLHRMEAGGQVVRRDEPRADGSARTCTRWYPAAVMTREMAA